MEGPAAEDLRKLVTDRLVDAGLVYDGAKTYVTPRRLTLAVYGVPVHQPDLREEKKGPRVGAPDAAIAGFLLAVASAVTLARFGEAENPHEHPPGHAEPGNVPRQGLALTLVLSWWPVDLRIYSATSSTTGAHLGRCSDSVQASLTKAY